MLNEEQVRLLMEAKHELERCDSIYDTVITVSVLQNTVKLILEAILVDVHTHDGNHKHPEASL